MVYVTHIRLNEGSGHEHISDVKWRNPSNKNTGQSTRAGMVEWIKEKSGDARVTDGTNEVRVGVVEASPPHIRTYHDGKWTDNLLALPRF